MYWLRKYWNAVLDQMHSIIDMRSFESDHRERTRREWEGLTAWLVPNLTGMACFAGWIVTILYAAVLDQDNPVPIAWMSTVALVVVVVSFIRRYICDAWDDYKWYSTESVMLALLAYALSGLVVAGPLGYDPEVFGLMYPLVFLPANIYLIWRAVWRDGLRHCLIQLGYL